MKQQNISCKKISTREERKRQGRRKAKKMRKGMRLKGRRRKRACEIIRKLEEKRGIVTNKKINITAIRREGDR